jgi:hypothetical protein
MATTEVVAAGLVAALVQGIQAWMAMARQAGLTEEQIAALMDEQYSVFKVKINTPLPDPDK